LEISFPSVKVTGTRVWRVQEARSHARTILQTLREFIHLLGQATLWLEILSWSYPISLAFPPLTLFRRAGFRQNALFPHVVTQYTLDGGEVVQSMNMMFEVPNRELGSSLVPALNVGFWQYIDISLTNK
jgi:hypothetical protein